MKKEVKHTTFRNNKLFCSHCGGEYAVIYPIGVTEMNKKIDAFNVLHGDCEKTWIEPIPDLALPARERAVWWLINGERGSSSETMWNCLMRKEIPGFSIVQNKISHPHDPDDFKRCYKLLQAVPEWKGELHKLKPLSPAWSNLVDNWDKLTAMYEQNVKEQWVNADKIGMYEFMESLIK